MIGSAQQFFTFHDQDEAMSISDLIVVMKLGVVQQTGKPQDIYDNPANLFVAKFLGTPPINVFDGEVKNGALYVGEDCLMKLPGIADQPVHVGIRPEGFVLDKNGPLHMELVNVEVMGRDMSVISKNAAAQTPTVRSIIDSDLRSEIGGETVSFSIKPNKIFVFHKETEERLY